jgi:hypothetical protein
MTREVMQQALEALENAVLYHGIMLMSDPPQDAWKYHRVEDNAKQAITAIKEALAQPVQKPVACRFCHSKKGCYTWLCYSCGEIDDVQQPAPPAAQRPWQGLTTEEIMEIIGVKSSDSDWNVIGVHKWIRATEAKLKGKNYD